MLVCGIVPGFAIGSHMAGVSTKQIRNDREKYLNVLFHQISEVGEQWIMFSDQTGNSSVPSA